MRNSVVLYMFMLDITLDGGCERVVVNMANEFINYYSKVYIISNFNANKSVKYNLDERVEIKYLHKNSSIEEWKSSHIFNILFKSTFIYNLLFSIGYTNKLYRYIFETCGAKMRPVVLIHGYQTPWYRKKCVKLIGVDHSNFPFSKRNYSNPLNKIKFSIISFMNRKLDVVTVLTNAEIDFWKLLKRPVYVIPNFIPNIPAQIVKVTNRNKVILSMGRMDTEQKGFDRLIKAYSNIAKSYPEWQLRIFGSGKFKEKYLNQIFELGMSDFIKIFDFTNKPDEEYEKSSVYIMCSRTEGFGMVLAEAMSFGVPTISYTNTGPNEIIKDNYSGFLIPNGHENILCEKIETLINNQKILETFSINAHRDIKERFSKEEILKKWMNIIEA